MYYYTMKVFFVSFGLSSFLCGAPHIGRSLPESSEGATSWPLVRLSLSGKPNLKEIFDSGLRPYRFPQMEEGLLEAKHFRVIVEIKGQESLPEFQVEYASIGVFEGGNIASIHFTTPQLDFTDSKHEMNKWLSMSSYDEGELESFLGIVRENPQFWKSQAKEDKISRGFPTVWNAVSGSQKPLRMRLGFSWSLSYPLNMARNYRKPIPPPSGYEHVSMDAPKNFGPDAPSQSSVDARMAQLIKERGLKAVGKDSGKESSKKENRSTTKSELAADSKSQDEYSRLPWITVGALVVGLVAWFLRFWKHRPNQLRVF